ncbi:hypothetical protein ACFVYD_32085 [Streptomyces sp. NPDC058301]|uniref:hypothetical protein n=1 Tax=Streptomyces sp. NPDC058301 TaxID=3346436 RepID=UPI0036E2746C
MVTDGEWERIRGKLRFGQVLRGTVVGVPRPGAIGIFVDIGYAVGGFVDVLLLPQQAQDWPAHGTVTDFEVWSADSRHQVRLKPSDPRYLRTDFADFAARFRPSWPTDLGRPVHDGRPVTALDPAALRDRQEHTAFLHGDQRASIRHEEAQGVNQDPKHRAGLGRLLGSFPTEALTWPKNNEAGGSEA